MRWVRHGDANSGHPPDRGSRQAHPLYQLWGSLKRYRKREVCKEWLEDLWAFANEVKDYPDSDTRVYLERIDDTKPLGPGNWYWKRPILPNANLYTKAEQQRRFRERNPDAYFKYHCRRYGTTVEWYEEALRKQNGLCAICGNPETLVIKGKVPRLAIDHCHHTKVVRGLLCSKCNQGIGCLNHDKGLLMKAIAYLELHNGDKQ